MKNIFYILLCLLLFSCKTQKESLQNFENTILLSKQNNLTEVEKDIVNDFLNIELKKDRYINYKDYQYVIIEEVLKKTKPLADYEFNFKYKKSWGKTINNWILDSLQIQKIKTNLQSENQFYWKESDFKNTKVSLLKNEELRTIINTGAYIKLPHRLIIFLSKPLIIDNNSAFLSFDIGNGDLGNNAIKHFTVLMKKINNTWKQEEFYYDNVFY